MAWATASSADGWSLEGRLRNRLLLALLALWLLGSGLSLYVHWTESNELLDAAQEETAATLLRLPAPSAPHLSIPALAGAAGRPPIMLMQVYTGAGRLVWRSIRAPDTPLAPLSRRGMIDEGDWRVVVRHSPEVDRIVVVGASLQGRRDALLHAVEAQLLPLLALLPLTALTVTWLLRSVFVRLDEVRGELRRRDTDQLDPLDGPGLPRELQPLVDTLNQLFARLTEVRQAERAFAANSAHELRTPLAAAQAQLQRLVHELRERAALVGAAGEPDGAMQRAEAVARQLDRLERVCVKLLQLSRAEAGVGRHTVPLDLVEVTRLVLEDFHQPDQRARLRLSLPPADLDALAGGTERHVMALGDVDALGIALRNLVENALLHGGRQIEVRIGHEPAITVADDGPGVAPARLAGLQRPFVRGESASSPGHGLGLAIVATLARQMNGRLVLESPLQGGSGFAATLVLQPVPAQVQAAAPCPDDNCR